MDHNIKPVDVEMIAKTCHEVNRAFCAGMYDHSHKAWEFLPQFMKDSVISGVKLHLEAGGEGVTPGMSHQAWMDYKLAEGWRYGPEKNVELRTHPNLVPFYQLPYFEQAKDHLFAVVVRAMRDKT